MTEHPVFTISPGGNTYLLRYRGLDHGVQAVLVATFSARIAQIITWPDTGEVFYRIECRHCAYRGGGTFSFEVTAQRFNSTRWMRRMTCGTGGVGACVAADMGAMFRRSVLQLSGITEDELSAIVEQAGQAKGVSRG